jgi:hypothetical protein
VNALNRLQTLQAENESIGFDMLLEKGRFAALASRHEDGTAPRAVSSFNLFQTPKDIADRMASLIPQTCRTILEPSAGLGRLYNAIRARNKQAHISLVEQSADCCRELYAVTEQDELTAIKQADFLSVEPAREGNCGLIIKQLPEAFYDSVIMNPPFKQGRDVKHILHALKFVKPGGVVIALCYNGVKQNKQLKPLADSWEVLPEGTFRSEGTSASVVLLTMKGRTL